MQEEPIEAAPTRRPPALTLEKINLIAQTVGVAAVLVSLVFVGIQLQQNSALLEANTRSIKAQAGFEATHSWATSNEEAAMAPEEIIQLNIRTQDPNARLSDFSQVEQFRLLLSRRALFQKLEGQYFLYKYGSLDAVLWETRRDWAAGAIKIPFWAQWWEYEKTQKVWSPEFIAAIEKARDATTFEPWGSLPAAAPEEPKAGAAKP